MTGQRDDNSAKVTSAWRCVRLASCWWWPPSVGSARSLWATASGNWGRCSGSSARPEQDESGLGCSYRSCSRISEGTARASIYRSISVPPPSSSAPGRCSSGFRWDPSVPPVRSATAVASPQWREQWRACASDPVALVVSGHRAVREDGGSAALDGGSSGDERASRSSGSVRQKVPPACLLAEQTLFPIVRPNILPAERSRGPGSLLRALSLEYDSRESPGGQR